MKDNKMVGCEWLTNTLYYINTKMKKQTKTKTEYIYEIHTIDTGNTNAYSKNADKAGDKYLKTFSSHGEAEEYVDSLKKGSAYDIHYLKVNSKFRHVTISLV